jgi:hypothetical protein
MELLPGPFIPDNGFQKAYTAMAEHAGKSLAQSIEMRYDHVKKQLTDFSSSGATASGVSEDEAREMTDELSQFGEGPAEALQAGTAERTQWFDTWVQENCNEDDGDEMGSMMNNPRLLELARQRGLIAQSPSRIVRVGTADQVKAALEANEALPKWGTEIEQCCGLEGMLMREDPSDDTAQVVFEDKNFSIWLPQSTLSDVFREVCPREKLQPAVEAHPALKWHDRLADTCGKHGLVLKVDNDGTSNMRFPCLDGMEVWLPTPCLADLPSPAAAVEPDGELGPGDGKGEESPEGGDTKRQRTA